MKFEYVTSPFPHLRVPEVIAPELYRQIRFPDLKPLPDGRIGRDLFRGEEGWSEIVRQPGWNELYQELSSLRFVKTVLDYFREPLKKYNCLVDPDKVTIEEFNETRPQVKSPLLSRDYDPNALFTRFDFQAGGADYRPYVHVDWPRRIVGGVLFMCSAEEEGIEGGEFGLYSDKQPRGDRLCHAPKLEKFYPIAPNSGCLFLNFNSGFHGPLPIRRITGLRKWLYYSISSRRNVWQMQDALVG